MKHNWGPDYRPDNDFSAEIADKPPCRREISPPPVAPTPINALRPIDYSRRSDPCNQAVRQAAEIIEAEDRLAPGSTFVGIAYAQLRAAQRGDNAAAREIWDRSSGKPVQELKAAVAVAVRPLWDYSNEELAAMLAQHRASGGISGGIESKAIDNKSTQSNTYEHDSMPRIETEPK